MTPVSLEHIRQLQVLLLRMRSYLVTDDGSRPSTDKIMRCEQLGYDHMALTGKGHVYLEEYSDGIELLDPVAYKLTHKHFRDLTYNYFAGNTHLTATDVIAQFDEQLARYAEFLAEHTPPVTLDEPDFYAIGEKAVSLAKKYRAAIKNSADREAYHQLRSELEIFWFDILKDES